MLITTTETIQGKKYETLGLVKGNTIQSVHLGKDIMNSFKTIVGGELTSYNEMMNTARDLAVQRMISDAQAMGADAIICNSSPGSRRDHGLRHSGEISITEPLYGV